MAKILREVRPLYLFILMVGVTACATLPEKPLEISEPRLVEDLAPANIDLAEKALIEERFDDAQTILERLVSRDPDDLRTKLAVAELRLATGATEKAAEDFENLMDSPQFGARAMQGRGIALMRAGDREEAYGNLRGALAMDDALWRAWNALGYYYDLKREWAKAASAYGRAIEVQPEIATVYNNRGFSRIMQGELELAVDDLNTALRFDDKLELARANLRLAVAWQGNYAYALSGVAKEHQARALNNVGFIALLRGDYGAAEGFFNQAMEADPAFNNTAWKNLNYLKNMQELQDADAAPAP